MSELDDRILYNATFPDKIYDTDNSYINQLLSTEKCYDKTSSYVVTSSPFKYNPFPDLQPIELSEKLDETVLERIRQAYRKTQIYILRINILLKIRTKLKSQIAVDKIFLCKDVIDNALCEANKYINSFNVILDNKIAFSDEYKFFEVRDICKCIIQMLCEYLGKVYFDNNCAVIEIVQDIKKLINISQQDKFKLTATMVNDYLVENIDYISYFKNRVCPDCGEKTIKQLNYCLSCGKKIFFEG